MTRAVALERRAGFALALSSARNMRAIWINFFVCRRRSNTAPFVHRQMPISS
jgi:hypothetical protein